MTRQFNSIGAFVEHLQRARIALPRAQEHGIRKGAELIQDEAKSLIGTEYAGWPELAASTIAEKQRLGFTGRISAEDPLYRTGELRATILVRADETGAKIGTDDPIAEYQEGGTTRIPPRPFMAPAAYRKGEAAAEEVGRAAFRAIVTGQVPGD